MKAGAKLQVLGVHGYLQDSQVWLARSLACRSCTARLDKRARPVITAAEHLHTLQVFNQKTGSVRKALKSLAEFHYVDAPHEALAQEADAAAYGAGSSTRRAWWTWQVRLLLLQ